MSVEQERIRLAQDNFLKSIFDEPRPTEMLTVYLSESNSSCYDRGIYCALVPLDKIQDVLSDCSWSFSYDEGGPTSFVRFHNGQQFPEYSRFGSGFGIEPLIINISFNGLKGDYLEVSEEFRLFHNLYHDLKNGKFVKIDRDGSEFSVVEFSDDCVKIRLKEIKQFLAIKEMFLLIQFDCKEYSALALEDLFLEEEGYENKTASAK